MNEDILKGQWKQIRGQVKQWWGMLTDDDLDKINGKRDQLIGKLQERYGYTKEQASRQIDERLTELQQRVMPMGR
ncbi:MAG: CsbD family protein [Chloroflexi bacterium]|nr:CsbD family protein [Chloroflexota bacterium]